MEEHIESNINPEDNDEYINNNIYIPKKIKIGNYYYIFKNGSKNDANLFTYRYFFHLCRITININRKNLNKIIKGEKNR